MIWTGNNNETNKFESGRNAESLDIPTQELTAGLNKIRNARSQVEFSISDVLAQLAKQSYNAQVEKVREEALAKVAEKAHHYPLADTSETPTDLQQTEPDILHEEELDADTIRTRLNGIRDTLEGKKDDR